MQLIQIVDILIISQIGNDDDDGGGGEGVGGWGVGGGGKRVGEGGCVGGGWAAVDAAIIPIWE